MIFTMDHTNFNVLNLDTSIAFYRQALGLSEVSRIKPDDGSFELVFLGDGGSSHRIELTWLRDRSEPYELGDNETHLCFTTDDFDTAYALHKDMGCICYENPAMGLYFISDPDGYWLEIISAR